MKDIRILVSACGAPGCSTLIRYLRGVTERNIDVVGIDSDNEAVGRFLSNAFYQVPLADEKEYIETVNDIIQKEDIDVFFCVSSAEVPVVAKNKALLERHGCKVMVSGATEIEVAENKATLYETLSKHGIPTPKFRVVNSFSQFMEAINELGYPDNPVCFKPPVSKGSRGFRILNESISRRELIMNHKPISLYISLAEFKDIFENDADFPTLLVMEVVEGRDYDVMALCGETGALLVTVKTRESSRWGVINKGELVASKLHTELTEKIIDIIPLRYNICLQFIGDKIIEINPRTSTFIYQENLNEPYLAVKLALGEISEEETRRFQPRIHFGRRMIRYMDQVFFDKNKIDFGPLPHI